MCANIGGLKIHPDSTNKPLPILTSAKGANMPLLAPRSGVISVYKIISCSFQICTTSQKPPPQKVDADGRFLLDENP